MTDLRVASRLAGNAAATDSFDTAALDVLDAKSVLVLEINSFQSVPPTVTGIVSASGTPELTWTKRGGIRLSPAGYQDHNFEVWYAVCDVPMLAAQFTVTLSGVAAVTAYSLFAVSGADLTTPWDTNVALPATGSNDTTTPAAPALSLSTTAADTLAFMTTAIGYAPADANNGSLGSGFSRLSRWGSGNLELVSQYQVYSSEQSSVDIDFGTFTCRRNVFYADALQKAADGDAVTWNPNDNTGITLSNGNLTGTKPFGAYAAARATQGRSIGKYYFEVDVTGLTNSFTFYGLATLGADLLQTLPDYETTWGATNGEAGGGGQDPFHAVYAFRVDLFIGKAEVTWDGVNWQTLATGIKEPVFPYIHFGTSGGETIVANFGASAFHYDVPDGYQAWDNSAIQSSGFATFLPHSPVISLNESGLIATHDATGTWGTTYGSYPAVIGKYYFEVTTTLAMANGNYIGIGGPLMELEASLTYPGYNNMWAVRNYYGTLIDPFGHYTENISPIAIPAGSVYGVAVDLDNKMIWFNVNGGLWNGSATADPGSNIGGKDISAMCVAGVMPMVAGSQASFEFTGNFGQSQMVYGAPAGFVEGWPGAGSALVFDAYSDHAATSTDALALKLNTAGPDRIVVVSAVVNGLYGLSISDDLVSPLNWTERSRQGAERGSTAGPRMVTWWAYAPDQITDATITVACEVVTRVGAHVMAFVNANLATPFGASFPYDGFGRGATTYTTDHMNNAATEYMLLGTSAMTGASTQPSAASDFALGIAYATSTYVMGGVQAAYRTTPLSDASESVKHTGTSLADQLYSFDAIIAAGQSPGTAIPGHRYWRLAFSANNGGAVTDVSEIELRAEPGGANIASGGTILGSADDGTNIVANAFDGDPDTYASLAIAAVGNDVIFLGYDFGNSPQEIEEIVVACNSGTAANYPKEIWVLYSDDGFSWKVKWAILNQTAWGSAVTFTHADPGRANGRFWGLFISSTTYDDATHLRTPAMAALQFHAAPGGPDICIGGTTFESSHSDSYYTADHLFDGDDTTSWKALTFTPQYVGYDLGEGNASDAQEVAITGDRYNPPYGPNKFDVIYSVDGIYFEGLVNLNDQPGQWAYHVTQTFEIPSGGLDLAADFADDALLSADITVLATATGRLEAGFTDDAALAALITIIREIDLAAAFTDDAALAATASITRVIRPPVQTVVVLTG